MASSDFGTAMVRRLSNRPYVLPLHIVRPVCLEAKQEEEVWRWHVRFSHISFDALERMAKKEMVRGLTMIEHDGELWDSCLAGKHRRQPFPKKAKFRA
ncbi:hypothetical protein U9M48_019454 [Paspalum notatum var. saurae]|uniref:GAG-pre-integrase domain-containing protein n=1 Tax=Paspalum notatum var. saurae TaxID=547442 RepID=A0AAQ3TFQ0_PASNO